MTSVISEWIKSSPIHVPIHLEYPRDQYSVQSSYIFINDITKINLLPGIKTSTTIYVNDVQLLSNATPNNLQLLKANAETWL